MYASYLYCNRAIVCQRFLSNSFFCYSKRKKKTQKNYQKITNQNAFIGIQLICVYSWSKFKLHLPFVRKPWYRSSHGFAFIFWFWHKKENSKWGRKRIRAIFFSCQFFPPENFPQRTFSHRISENAISKYACKMLELMIKSNGKIATNERV